MNKGLGGFFLDFNANKWFLSRIDGSILDDSEKCLKIRYFLIFWLICGGNWKRREEERKYFSNNFIKKDIHIIYLCWWDFIEKTMSQLLQLWNYGNSRKMRDFKEKNHHCGWNC